MPSDPSHPSANSQSPGARPAAPHCRVLLVTNIPTPYRIPLFNELNRQFIGVGIALKVVFAAMGYPRRKWNLEIDRCAFDWQSLDCSRLFPRDPDSAIFTYGGLGRVLRAWKPDAVIVSGFSLATMRLWLQAYAGGAPYLIWSGAIPRRDETERRTRRWQRMLLVRGARGFIAYGSRARDYLVELGAKPESVSIGINTVDTNFFRAAAETAAPRTAQATLQLVCIGNLVTGKRVDLLFPILRRLKDARREVALRVIGQGAAEAALRELARQHDVAELVLFEGFKQRNEVARILADADCLLFPSDIDVWGLVLVEAMAAGVVCLASIRAGATVDLIQDGVTGFHADFEDAAAVAARLAELIDSPSKRIAVGKAAQAAATERFSLARSASGFVSAALTALEAPPRAYVWP